MSAERSPHSWELFQVEHTVNQHTEGGYQRQLLKTQMICWTTFCLPELMENFSLKSDHWLFERSLLTCSCFFHRIHGETYKGGRGWRRKENLDSDGADLDGRDLYVFSKACG